MVVYFVIMNDVYVPHIISLVKRSPMFLFFASPLGNAMCAFIYIYLRKTPRCLEGACPKRNTTRDHCRRWGPRLHSVQTVCEIKKATRETIPFSWNWTAGGVGTLMSTPHNYQQWRNDSTFFEPYLRPIPSLHKRGSFFESHIPNVPTTKASSTVLYPFSSSFSLTFVYLSNFLCLSEGILAGVWQMSHRDM